MIGTCRCAALDHLQRRYLGADLGVLGPKGRGDGEIEASVPRVEVQSHLVSSISVW